MQELSSTWLVRGGQNMEAGVQVSAPFAVEGEHRAFAALLYQGLWVFGALVVFKTDCSPL